MSTLPRSLGSNPNQPVCPYCRAGFDPEDEIKLCPACNTPHHADCFAENGGCTIFGCTAAPADDPKISVTPTDFHPAPPVHPPLPGTSLYNLNAPAAAAENRAAPIAPPPLPPGTGAPPPPPIQMTPYFQPATPQPYPAYTYGTYVRPKSRVAFVLLAVFLGSFGAHNFYAGYNKKAITQLLITLCTCFYAALITWIWAIVEACTVTQDDDGVLLN